MKLTFLGTGDFFTNPLKSNNFNSSILIEINDKKLLIDVGFYLLPMLTANNLKIEDISDVYITHCHGDHITGLEVLAYYNKFKLNRKINLYLSCIIKQDLFDYLNSLKINPFDFF